MMRWRTISATLIVAMLGASAIAAASTTTGLETPTVTLLQQLVDLQRQLIAALQAEVAQLESQANSPTGSPSTQAQSPEPAPLPTSATAHQAPVIAAISGPTTLNDDNTRTRTINANDIRDSISEIQDFAAPTFLPDDAQRLLNVLALDPEGMTKASQLTGSAPTPANSLGSPSGCYVGGKWFPEGAYVRINPEGPNGEVTGTAAPLYLLCKRGLLCYENGSCSTPRRF